MAYIDFINDNGTNYDIESKIKTWIGTCTTAADQQKKVATVDTGFILTKGQRVGIKFTNTNTYSSTTSNPITLNVNNSGDINIYYNNTHSGAGNTGTNGNAYGIANRYNFYVYDGTYWVWDSKGNDNDTTYSPQSLGNGYGTCSTAAATAAKVVTLSGYELKVNGYVSVKFTYDVPANATMNVNSKGAKSIYYHGSAITANIIKAGDLATFIYYDSKYHLVGVDRLSTDIQTLTNLAEPLKKTVSLSASSSAQSFTSQTGVTGDMEAIRYSLQYPSQVTGDITVTTSSSNGGTIVVNANVITATQITLWFMTIR